MGGWGAIVFGGGARVVGGAGGRRPAHLAGTSRRLALPHPSPPGPPPPSKPGTVCPCPPLSPQGRGTQAPFDLAADLRAVLDAYNSNLGANARWVACVGWVCKQQQAVAG